MTCLGPAGGVEEELDQTRRPRLSALFGRYAGTEGVGTAGEEMDELATDDTDEGEEGNTESGVPAGSTYFPSSMGMSFVVDGDTKEIVDRDRVGSLPSHQERDPGKDRWKPRPRLEA